MNTKFYQVLVLLLLASITGAVMAGASSLQAIAEPAGDCQYELGECPNAQEYWKQHRRDYQIEVYMDTLWLYDGDRMVGRINSTQNDTGAVMGLILADNE